MNAPITTSISPLLGNSTILHRRGRRGGGLYDVALRESLGDIRDLLARMAEFQEAEDHERTFSQLAVTYEADGIKARLINNTEDPWLVTKTAYTQMDASLLPRSGGNFLRELSGLDHPSARRAATATWHMFATQDAEKPRKFRTIKRKMPDGSIKRILRAQVSQGYASYSNLEFLEAVLANTDLGELKVLDYRIEDDAMRVRVAALQPGQEVEVGESFPMFSLWNGETGRRLSRFDGGLFRPSCLNGLGAMSKEAKYAWRHFGSTERIRQGVASAAQEISVSMNGTLEAYKRAADVFIDDTFSFIDQILAPTSVSQATIEAIKTRGITDPTSHDSSSLAGVVDGMTLIAQDPEYDLFDTDFLEQIAADVMLRGLGMAERERILVKV